MAGKLQIEKQRNGWKWTTWRSIMAISCGLILLLSVAKYRLTSPHVKVDSSVGSILWVPSNKASSARDYLGTELPPPQGAPDVYLLYMANYGQMHNQLQSFFNAFSEAITLRQRRNLEVALVLPQVFRGAESDYEANALGYKTSAGFENRANFAGQFLDLNKMQGLISFITHDDFLDLLAKDESLTDGSIRLFDKQSFNYYSSMGIPGSVQAEDFGVYTYLQKCFFTMAMRKYDLAPRAKIVFLPKVFTPHTTDCSDVDPWWLEIRKRVVVREEFRRSVEEYFLKIPRPITGVHLRLLGGELAQMSNETMLEIIEKQIGYAKDASGSLYIAYSPGQEKMREIVAHLREKLPQVYACEDMPNCGSHRAQWADNLSQDEFDSIFRGVFSTVSMDSWALVQSDKFFGRTKSSMSMNVHFWRKIGLGGTASEEISTYDLTM
mmetsp:Transcript_4390/g.13303  ORF Transcript_4390/g.13303 Transcript_4390/m.13303 type:complete len:437 (-) Transcript_4390:1889-3199(-)